MRLRAGVAAYLPLVLVPVFAALALWRPAIVEDSIEGTLVDWRFKARNAIAAPKVPPNIVVVAIDEASIARYGRWPWSRARIAELVDKVAAGKPRAIGVDLFFPQSESAAADARLADALGRVRGIAAEAVAFEVRRAGAPADARAPDAEAPDALLDDAISRVEKASELRPLEAGRVLLPPPAIAAASNFGHVNYLPDANGKLRWEYLYLRHAGEFYPSLALQVARLARGLPLDAIRIVGGFGVDFGGELIPADDHGRYLVNYYGGERTFPHYSAGAILGGDTPAAVLEDCVVFIGATGIATYDLIVTPFAEGMPGVEKNATVAANILNVSFLRDAPLSADLLVIVLAGLAVFLLCRHRRAAVSFVALFFLTCVLVAVNYTFFVRGVRLALAYPLFLVALQGVATVAQQYLAEERVSREMRRMFSSYVTKRVVDQLIDNPEMARLGGERREVTILFSDIRGFTTFSERHGPEEVVRTLNEYLGAMTEVVFRWEGTLDKFIGDAVMAFWGAPLAQEDHAERALRCALHMQGRLAELNAAWAAAGRGELRIGIGINTGEVIVGNIGAEGKKMEYTVIGDQVNLASRVESLTKKYGCGILITASTLAKVRPLIDGGGFGHVAVRGLDDVAVKGKEQPVRVYEFAPEAHGGETTVEELAPGRAVVHMTEK
jgi:adenylate cyclase